MTDIVNFNSAYITIGDFDSRRRYMRRDLLASSSAFDLPLGFTLQIGQSGRVAVFRYSVNGYVVEGPPFTTTGLTFNATSVRVRI